MRDIEQLEVWGDEADAPGIGSWLSLAVIVWLICAAVVVSISSLFLETPKTPVEIVSTEAPELRGTVQ
jgi:hypothetical protein